MFCSQCGKSIPDNAKFCPSCGKALASAASTEPSPASPQPSPTPNPPTAPVAAPPADFSGLGACITGTLQGASGSLKVNGSYDEVSFGRLTPQGFIEMVKDLASQPPAEGEDVSPVNIMAKGPKSSLTLMIDGGRLVSASGDNEYSPEDAVRKMLGQAQSRQPKLPKDWKPVRRPEIPPTDRDEADPSLIDLQQQPQIRAQAWAGDFTKFLWIFSWFILAIGCLVILGSFGPFQGGPFLVGLLLIGGALATGRLAKNRGYLELRLGGDWATNTLWVNFDKQTRITPDLSCIADFTLAQRTRHSTTGRGLQKRTNTQISFLLEAQMSSGKVVTVQGLPEMPKKKAEEVLQLARQLLARL